MDDADSEGEPLTAVGHSFDWGDAEDGDGLEPDVLRFEVGRFAFAIEVAHVHEVDSPPAITEVPGLPDHVLGVALRRRQVLSIVDLATFLRIETRHAPCPSRLLVVDADGITAGVLVSAVTGLEVWPDEDEGLSLDDLGPQIRPFVLSARWAPGGRVLLLDLPELIRAAAVR